MGHSRIARGVLAGVVAALVVLPSATPASATFLARSLAPTQSIGALELAGLDVGEPAWSEGTVTATWDATAQRPDVTPEYQLTRTIGSESVALPAPVGSSFTDDFTVPAAIEGQPVTAITAGGTHTCALAGGNAYCWGSANGGRLGNGTTSGDQPGPSAVIMPTGTTFTQITAGPEHTCALTDQGTAYCWGWAGNGRLGNGATSPDEATPVPTTMPAGVTFTQIAAGDSYTCALTDQGTAYCWGWAIHGRLGNGAIAGNQTTPSAVMVPAGVSFTDLQTGGHHTCALTDQGAAYCWGWAGSGRLGNGATGGNQATPVAVTMPEGVTFDHITAGSEHTCALTSQGAAYCWGSAVLGRLGTGETSGVQATPVAVTMPADVSFQHITAGVIHTCVLTSQGAAYCWGFAGSGRLGNGTTSPNQATPVAVTMPEGVTFDHLTAGSAHTCSIAGEGGAYCWGWGASGRLGNGATRGDQVTPAPVLPGDMAVARCLDGWNARADDRCVPGPDIEVSYSLTSTLRGWTAPATTITRPTEVAR